MTASQTRARHRAARRPVASLSSAVAGNVSSFNRRTAVVAASGGLLVSMLGVAGPANAAPVDQDSGKLNAVDTSNLTAEARQALEAAPAVTVDKDLKWDLETAKVQVTAAPEPEPEPVRVEAAASRTEERTESTSTAAATTTSTTTTETAAPAEESTASEAPASSAGSSIISIAGRYVGTPYVYGGTTPSGFDCSGFTSYVYAQAGITLPRTSGAQAAAGTTVSRANAQPGDLIYSPGHIAIYAGGNTMIDAPRPGKTVQFRQIWMSNPQFIRI
ncbi:Cell wall-associated hydrolase, NlpC family [Paraoerskovia marina]|uniref:Cell wall-associated hydrolase, NlpC family n=1 Tax=Paraoerskovia marina TaxID=545619 RepID=A0A1H1QAM4_9CELL|nr:C40 family peptidase [Paraoerskovia marina]SDS19929.1 Cell wall-associated hydrolase, NlpC family [Paraoerskovia marina]